MANIPSPAFKGFRIIRTIGSGGMSTVFEAVDQKLERKVALKVLHVHLHKDSAARARFRREALAAARLAHPNIVQIYDYLDQGNTQCIVMEYVPGLDMETIVKKKGGLPFDTVLAIMTPVAAALAEAHQHGIMHRDIKPSNVLLDRKNRVMLSDFGLARQSFDPHLTRSDAVAGTPGYMSPEQIAGRDLAFSSDIYSWAVTFHFLLAGRLPYTAREFTDFVNEIRAGRAVIDEAVRRDVPPKYLTLLENCLMKDPDGRVPDGTALKSLLDKYAESRGMALGHLVDFHPEEILGPSSPEGVSQTQLYRGGLFTVRRFAAAGGVVVLVFFGLYFGLLRKKTPRPEQVPAPDTVKTENILAKDTSKPEKAASARAPKTDVPKKTHPKAPEARKARADSGQLFIACDSAWANIMVDGVHMGKTPLEAPLTLPRGRHLIRLYSEFIEPVEEEVEIVSGTVVRRRYVLKLKPAYR
jgi:serine/threonine-protein kinase